MTAPTQPSDSPGGGGKYTLFDQVPPEDPDGSEVPGKTSPEAGARRQGKEFLLDEDEIHSIYDEEGVVNYADRQRKRRRWCWFGAGVTIVLVIIFIMVGVYRMQSPSVGVDTQPGSSSGTAPLRGGGEGDKSYPTGPVIVPTEEEKKKYKEKQKQKEKDRHNQASKGGNKGKGDWQHPKQSKNPLTLMSLAMNGLFVQQFSYTWEPSTGRYTTIGRSGDLVAHAADGQEEVLAYASGMKDNEGQRFSPRSYTFSHDSKFILFKIHSKKQWRHSDKADYIVFDREKQRSSALTLTGEPGTTQIAQWAPKGHHIAFVRGNDVYVKWNLEHEVRLTNDGSHTIYNGVADWVYEEEVLSDTRAFWWAPDGTKLVYFKFDDERVRDYEIPYYFDKNSLDGRQQYSHVTKLKYPKPGTPNPKVSVHIATLGDGLDKKKSKVSPNSGQEIDAHPELTRDIPLPRDDELHGMAKEVLGDTHHVFARVDWLTTGNDRFALQVLSRVQDQTVWLVVNVSDFAVEDADNKNKPKFEVHVERAEERKDGWYDPQYVKGLVYLPQDTSGVKNADTYLQVGIHPGDGYEHIAMFKLGQRKPVKWLTKGDWTVLADSVSIDHRTGKVYFVATVEGSTTRGVYTVRLSDKNVVKPKSITPQGKNSFYDADFSPNDAELMILSYKGPDLPSYSVCDTEAKDIYKTCRTLVSNDQLHSRMKNLGVATKEFHEVEKDDYKMNVALYKPPNFVDDGTVRYPVIINVYGGPDSQEVTREFDLFRPRSVMASALNVIVCVVDGRGTGFKGKDFRFRVKGEIGVHEAEDVLHAAAWLGKKDYVDADRIGIWGWSYGGFLTCKVVEYNKDRLIKAAFAVAPVTDWRFYDSIYTERYMGLPDKNENGYIATSVKATDAFDHTHVMLAHGTGDDNVHFQNTLALIRQLVRHSDKNYAMLVFPDSHHSMGFEGARSQLYGRIDQFFKKYLDLEVELDTSNVFK